MKAIKVELVFGVRTAKNFLKEIFPKIKSRYKPKQAFCYEVEYWSKK